MWWFTADTNEKLFNMTGQKDLVFNYVVLENKFRTQR